MKKIWICLTLGAILLSIKATVPLMGRGWILLCSGQITRRLLPIASYGQNLKGQNLCGYDEFLPLYCYAQELPQTEATGRNEKERQNSIGVVFNKMDPEMKNEFLLLLENQKNLMEEQIKRKEEQNKHNEGSATEEIDLISETPFIPHAKMQEIDPTVLQDFETLVREFYVIDNNTMAGKELLDAKAFLEKDFSVKKGTDEPQILIYHTHSLEEFADSEPGNEMETVVGVGERLTEILQEEYGYHVMHHKERYDTVRDKAYAKSLPAIEKILEQNPSIKVVIDLHRDAVPNDQRLVMNLDGRPTARFMFFNGLSRTNKTGEIAYLKNENLKDNLAFSFRMQKAAMEYYPGLSRKIYLKGYRYNMHLRPMSLLIELGAQNNTLEEAMNACEPLAHILDLVIGEDAGSE